MPMGSVEPDWQQGPARSPLVYFTTLAGPRPTGAPTAPAPAAQPTPGRAATAARRRRRPPRGLHRAPEFHIITDRFIDMNEISARFRMLGDPARLRLLRTLSLDRFNVSELTGILGPGAVGRVTAPRAAEGRRPGRRGTRRHLLLLPPGAAGQRRRPAVAAARRRVRAAPAPRRRPGPTTPASRKCGGCGGRTSTPTPAPTPATAASSCPAAVGRPGRGPSATCCPPLDVADVGCGEGYLTLEAARWARRVVGVDRSAAVLARARQLAERRRVTQRHLEARRHREAAACPTRASTSCCCRRRCTTPATRRASCARPRGCCDRAAGC